MLQTRKMGLFASRMILFIAWRRTETLLLQFLFQSPFFLLDWNAESHLSSICHRENLQRANSQLSVWLIWKLLDLCNATISALSVQKVRGFNFRSNPFRAVGWMTKKRASLPQRKGCYFNKLVAVMQKSPPFDHTAPPLCMRVRGRLTKKEIGARPSACCVCIYTPLIVISSSVAGCM